MEQGVERVELQRPVGLGGSFLRIYGNPDLVGVEVASAAASVLALSLGVALELGLGAATVALGAAAPEYSVVVARRLGVRLPLEAGRGHSFDVLSPPAPLRHALLLLEARVAVSSQVA